MTFFNKYPYTDFHELNLDWIISEVKRVEKVVDDFTVFNTLTWAGVWDASKSYVKWSIVQDVSGNGYISVKAVPSNVPLTNSDFWAQIANYSTLYAAFNQRISDLETTVGDNTDGLVKDVADNTADIADLQTDVDVLKGLVKPDVYLCIADSYGLDDIGIDRLSWCTQFATIKGLTLNDNYFKFYQSGAGFADNGGEPGGVEGKNFCDVLNTAIATLTAEQRSSVTHIIVGGGVNDWDGNDSDTATGITNFDGIAKTYFPNAKIYYVCCGWAIRPDIRTACVSRYTVSYETGSYLGWTVFHTAFQPLQDKNNLKDDGVHPTVHGSKLIASEIIGLLDGNISLPLDNKIYTVEYNAVQRGRAYLQGNAIHVYLGAFSPPSASSWTLSAGGTVLLAYLDCPILAGGVNSDQITATLNMKMGGTWKTKQVAAYLDYDSGHPTKAALYVKNNVEIDGSGFGSYTFSDWYISLESFTLPAND